MREVLIDLVLVKVQDLKGKYAKRTLERLEASDRIDPIIRKFVLDGFNDLFREITLHLEAMKR
jgi:hypothetical protein